MTIILLAAAALLLCAPKAFAKPVFIGGGEKGWEGWQKDPCWSLTDRERGGNKYAAFPHFESTEEGMGSLRSPEFVIEHTHLTANCGGWEGSAVHPSRFALRRASDGKVLRQYLPGNVGNDMSLIRWSVAELKGERVYFEARDSYGAEGYAWLQLAAVYLTSEGETDNGIFYTPLAADEGTGRWTVKEGCLTYEGRAAGEDCRITSPAFPAADTLRLTVKGFDGKGSAEEDEFKFSSGFNAWYDKKGLAGTVQIEVFDAATGRLAGRIGAPDSDDPVSVDIDTSSLRGRDLRVSVTDSGEEYWIGLCKIEAGEYTIDFTSDSLEGWEIPEAPEQLSDQAGIPFRTASQPAVLGEKSFLCGFKTDALYILGLDHCEDAWSWLGDKMGDITLRYADGSRVSYPVVLGESCWWGKKFRIYIQPFDHGQYAPLFRDTINLYPQGPSESGTYVSVIKPDPDKVLEAVTVENDPGTAAHFNVYGVTAANGEKGLRGLVHSGEFAVFIEKRPLRSGDGPAPANVDKLADVMYATANSFPKDFTIERPKDYEGPIVEFEGDSWARLMSNVFSHNALDMSKKVTEDGVYHTSTYGAPWYGYDGVGLYTDNPDPLLSRHHAGHYFDEGWTRDEGRCLCELIYLGFYDKAKDCARFTFDCARSWQRHPEITLSGSPLPPHIARILQRNDVYVGGGCFENDGHGQVATYIYNMWKRMPFEERKAWEKANWQDIKYLGDWPQWQLDHPEISRAKDGNLWSDSEGSGWDITTGYSIFCDLAQVEGLIGLAEIAVSAGHPEEARAWLATAEGLKKAIEKNYVDDDPKYGRVWTMKYSGFGGSSTLAPILFSADRTGFDIRKSYPEWAEMNRAAWQRTLDHFRPNAFGYGQGYMLISTLMYDEMSKAEELLRISGRCLYNPTYEPYIVPENVIYNEDFSRTARMGDLGNCVQQAEIMKALRIMGGVDDNDQEHIRLMPRLPKGWTGIRVENMPVVWSDKGRITRSKLSYTFRRSGGKGELDLRFEGKAPALDIRLGAFDGPIESVTVNGRPAEFTETLSGDSRWAHIKY